MPDSYALLKQLKSLFEAQFIEIVFCCNAPCEYLPSANAPVVTQAIELLRYLKQQPNGLDKLQRCLSDMGLSLSSAENFDISRLPRPTADLVGREAELQQLDAALRDAQVHLAVLVAGGGVGKSALSFAWLKAMQPAYQDCDKVFAWSFYSQGLHATQTSSTEFFQAALPFLGYQQELPKDDVEKGKALAKLLKQQKVLLILDGLEPLQHPPQVLDGELKDTGLSAFFDDLYAQGVAGLVLVSSRQPIIELEEWDAAYYRSLSLETLSAADGARLLTNLGVTGTAQDLLAACEDLSGHALALVLLGKLLKRRFNGMIERRDCLPPLWEEPKKGGHALRVLKFYETHLHTEDDELWQVVQAFMFLLGLFDRPMGLLERDALLKSTEIATPLRALDDMAWQQLEQQLEQAGLLLKHKESKPFLRLSSGQGLGSLEPAQTEAWTPRVEWDTHPLIRAYFGKRFEQSQPEHFRQAHLVLFDYYQTVPEQQQPDTLEDLQPLYRAVVHGCLAREFLKALDVYDKRIRREEGYSLHKLSAYSQDLTTLNAFFPQGWTQPVQQGLSGDDQAWLLAVASFCLMSLGRLAEAVEPRKADIKIFEKLEDWENASRDTRNLVGLYLPLGKVALASSAAQQAIEYAEKAKDLFQQMGSHAYLGHCLHLQGQQQAALATFAKAEALQTQHSPNTPQLYSLVGFLYCACLLDQTEDEVAVQQVLARGEYSLEIGKRNNHLITISLDLLTLALTHWHLGKQQVAEDYFQQAVTGIRKASFTLYLPFFLIERANFYLDAVTNIAIDNPIQQAQADLQEAGNLIRRCGMKLYQVDWHLAMARLENASHHQQQARALIELTGYKLRLKDLAS